MKTEAIRAYHARKKRAHDQPGWCPRDERQKALVAAQEKRASEAQRITFSEYADEYLTWCTSTSSRGATASLTSSSAGRSGAPKTHSVRQTGMRKRRGLEGVSWHGLRHTWASRLTMNGVEPRTLQTLGGWRSLAMVERYSHLSPDHLRSAVEKLVAPGGQGSPTPQRTGAPNPVVELDSNLTRLQDEASRAL